MKNIKNYFFGIIILFHFQTTISAQSCGNMNIQHVSDIASTCNFMVMTMMHDKLNRPYLYVANKEAGLKIYNISTISSPVLVATVPTSLYNNLDVMNLSQTGNFLYLALGNSFTNPQQGGMAIVDVANPLSPAVTDYYVVPNSNSGGGIVKTEGNYAYLGAMQSGLIILDVTNKNNISFVSQFIPDIHYPDATNPNPALYNARGMEIKNSIVYLCYDAGGLRIINCTNKTAPIETGRYSNPVMNGKPRAYNNIVLDDSLTYIAVDYCGVEILNVSDTSTISLVSWWNPYTCQNSNWFNTPVHANEIQYDKNCKHIFLSTGKSDMYVLDVANVSQPDSCNFYGGVSNNLGTWGIGIYENEIYLSYICAFIPFSSNWTGVKILTYTPCVTTSIAEADNSENTIFPLPASNQITIQSKNQLADFTKSKITITDMLGQIMNSYSISTSGNQYIIDISQLSNGMYFVELTTNNKITLQRFIKNNNSSN